MQLQERVENGADVIAYKDIKISRGKYANNVPYPTFRIKERTRGNIYSTLVLEFKGVNFGLSKCAHTNTDSSRSKAHRELNRDMLNESVLEYTRKIVKAFGEEYDRFYEKNEHRAQYNESDYILDDPEFWARQYDTDLLSRAQSPKRNMSEGGLKRLARNIVANDIKQRYRANMLT